MTMPTPIQTAPAITHDYSAPMRVWHWANAVLVSGQLLTILFLKVIVSARAAIPDMQREVADKGGHLTEQQGRAVAHVIGDRIWAWHIWLGLTLAACWLGWTVLQVLDPAGRRFGARLLTAARRYRLAPPADVTNRAEARHELVVKLTYAVFYLTITVMVLTGLALTWADDVAWLGSIEHSVKEVHNVAMYVIIGFVTLHVGGVVWSEITRDRGLISRMVSGGPGAPVLAPKSAVESVLEPANKR